MLWTSAPPTSAAHTVLGTQEGLDSWPGLMSPGRACSPLAAVSSGLWETSSLATIYSHSKAGVEGKAMFSQSPLLPTPGSPMGPEPAQE